MAFVPKYILILAFLIVIDFAAGLLIEQAEGAKRKTILALSLVANIGTLAIFKYFNFFNDNLREVASFLQLNYPLQNLSIILPIGLSFHTFQSMSYTIEVYRKNQKAERNLGVYALYVMFYPQLVAGPIERPQNLLFQFRREHSFDWSRVVSGLQLMAIGLFKKIVIADTLAQYVNEVYGTPSKFTGLPLLIATYFFTFQIFCDFSGYSDVARGAARVMGFELMVNFDKPYLATSIAEFWSRWHISLSTWFKDYLYIPLGGNRVNKWRHYANLFIVFLVSGFWHGANWTFLIWGALHGFYLIAALSTRQVREWFYSKVGLNRIPFLRKTIAVITVFNLVAFAWIFFRASDLNQAHFIVKHLFANSSLQNIFTPDVAVGLTLIALLIGAQAIDQKHETLKWLSARPLWLRWSAYSVFIMSFALFALIRGEYHPQQFIYFQF